MYLCLKTGKANYKLVGTRPPIKFRARDGSPLWDQTRFSTTADHDFHEAPKSAIADLHNSDV